MFLLKATLLLLVHLRTSRGSLDGPLLDNGTLSFALMISDSVAEQERGVLAGIKDAIESINNRNDILSDYTLNFVLMKSECNRNKALETLLQHVSFHSTGIRAVIDASCAVASQATAEISHIFGLSQLSCISSSPVLKDRSRFQRYFQLLPSSSVVAYTYAALMKEYNWKRVAFLVEDVNTYILQAEATKTLFTDLNISFTEYIFSSEQGLSSLDTQPFEISEERIFIIAASEKQVVNILCKAFLKGVRYPSHLLILFTEFLEERWLQTNATVCSVQQIKEVLNNSLVVSNLKPRPETNAVGLEESSSLYSPYCYDSIFALALALNSSLYTGQATNQTILDTIFGQLSDPHFSFEGSTGTVEFDMSGIRRISNSPVFQYRVADATNSSPGSIVLIGQVSQSTLNFSYSQDEDFQTVWTNGIPTDGSRGPDIITTLFLPVTIVICILASIGIILSLACLGFNIAYRNRKVVRITSPTLNLFILGGVLLFYIDVYFFVLPTYDSVGVRLTCNITTWLTVVAYTFCFGTIMAKMFRVWVIFRDPKPGSRKIVKDWTLIAAVLALLALDLVFLTIYTAIEQTLDPESLTKIVVNIEIPEQEGRRFVNYVCDSKVQEIVVGIYYGFKAILQVVALILAFLTRKVKVKGLDDAKYIATVIYITSLILVVIAICEFTVEGINAFAVVFTTGLLLAPTCVLGLLFVPTMVRLYKDPEGKHVFVIPTTNLNGVEEIDSLKARVRELEDKLQSTSYSANGETVMSE